MIIVVLKAKNLPNRRKLDKQNPYCIARIANIVDRTPAITRGGQTPEWNHESRFQLTTDMNPLLKLSVLDETKKSPVLIGDCEIDCSPVFSTTSDEGYDKWHHLLYAGRAAGDVYIEMTFYPTASAEPVKKKGAVTLHRNTVRPLPTRPGEEESYIDDDDEPAFEHEPMFNEEESFRSFKPVSVNLKTYSSGGGSMFTSDNALSFLSEFNSSNDSGKSRKLYPNPPQPNETDQFKSIFGDSIAKQIIHENPEKFQQLLLRNPDLAKSILGASNTSSTPSHSHYAQSTATQSSYNSHVPNGRYSTAGSSHKYGNRKSRSQSPIRSAPYATNLQSINASFDDLEKEVQTDWYKQNFGNSRYSRYTNGTALSDPLKISSALPKLPEFKTTGPPSPPRHTSINSHTTNRSKYVRKPPPLSESGYLFNPFPKKKPPLEDSQYENNMSSHLSSLEMGTLSSIYSADDDHVKPPKHRNYPLAKTLTATEVAKSKLKALRELDEFKLDSPSSPSDFGQSISSFDPSASTVSNWDVDSDDDEPPAHNKYSFTGKYR